MTSTRPAYGAAIAVAAVVLLGYVLTLAPSVTFWDAGELIAAAKTLGIPHPPGTPLFVMVAHVWAGILPVGEYAVRTNLLSALFSAAGAGFFFLVVHESLRAWVGHTDDRQSRAIRVGTAAAGALLAGFTFTNWQNSNETEVYAVATFTIAAMAWTALLWRRARGGPHASRRLLLILYLAGLSIGSHLLALLAGPAVLLFLVSTARSAPLEGAGARRAEQGEIAVIAGVWTLLIGTGLGSIPLSVAGGVGFIIAAAYAAGRGAGRFAFTGLALALIGVTPYLYLYLRSAQHPLINEAAPATLDALLAVIRRAQYPPRTPWDDPTLPSGPANPGRGLGLIGIQFLDYVTYFDWQWAKALGGRLGPLPLRTLVTLLFASLGLRGAFLLWKADRAVGWLLASLFLVTSLGLAGYMNFKPGFGRWYDVYGNAGDHEVRERDYFFVVSFIVWGLWAGVGLGAWLRRGLAYPPRRRRLAPAWLLVALAPVVLNWRVASRRNAADARLAGDFAYDLLNSAPPYAVLFTYGDNDTFPLWWAQEVEGVRRDVTVVCLALANTDWYMRQLRDTPTRPVEVSGLPPVWRDSVQARPDWPLHTMTDSMIRVAMNGYVVRGTQRIALGPLTRTLEDQTILYPNDLLSLSVVQRNVGRRPIVWAITTGSDLAGLGGYVVQRGLGFHLFPALPDTTLPQLNLRRLAGVPIDVPLTERLLWETYRYGGLLESGGADLESTSANAAESLAFPYVQLVYAYADRGQPERMDEALRRVSLLSPDGQLGAALEALRQSPPLHEPPKPK